MPHHHRLSLPLLLLLPLLLATAAAPSPPPRPPAGGGLDGRVAANGWEALAPSFRSHLAHRAMAGAHWSSSDMCVHSLKLLPACEQNSTAVQLLVTGVGRSGTHHITNVLQLKGFDVCHESVCRDGSVAWTYAVYDPDNDYVWQTRQHARTNHRFRHIFHVVRHPLHSIASLTTYLDKSWVFIGRHTPEVPGLATMQPVLRRALVHWVTWNRMISVYADQRFRTEDTPPVVICIAAGFNRTQCEHHVHEHAPRDSRKHPTVTWDDLHKVDPEFTLAAMEMAREYGYEPEPRHHGGPTESPSHDRQAGHDEEETGAKEGQEETLKDEGKAEGDS